MGVGGGWVFLGCVTPLSRGQPHSPNVNHCILHIRLKGHLEPRKEVGSLSPAEHLVGFEQAKNSHK